MSSSRSFGRYASSGSFEKSLTDITSALPPSRLLRRSVRSTRWLAATTQPGRELWTLRGRRHDPVRRPVYSLRSRSLSALLHLAQGLLAAASATARNVRKLFKSCSQAGGDRRRLDAPPPARARELLMAPGQHPAPAGTTHDSEPAQRAVTDERRVALFASGLQRSDAPSTARAAEAIMAIALGMGVLS